mmetsp:Transcript_1985/g.5028  ORF Transcript_1985/g.5028 Transcript_1985/m.5028 type:complete len:291 (-) Transcript_1985:155-1027(-)
MHILRDLIMHLVGIHIRKHIARGVIQVPRKAQAAHGRECHRVVLLVVLLLEVHGGQSCAPSALRMAGHGELLACCQGCPDRLRDGFGELPIPGFGNFGRIHAVLLCELEDLRVERREPPTDWRNDRLEGKKTEGILLPLQFFGPRQTADGHPLILHHRGAFLQDEPGDPRLDVVKVPGGEGPSEHKQPTYCNRRELQRVHADTVQGCRVHTQPVFCHRDVALGLDLGPLRRHIRGLLRFLLGVGFDGGAVPRIPGFDKRLQFILQVWVIDGVRDDIELQQEPHKVAPSGA